MTDIPDNIERFLQQILPDRIINNNDEFNNCKVIECTAKSSKTLDGFLSSVFQIQLTIQDKISSRTQQLSLFAKMLKAIGEFRDEVKLDEMTINELACYSSILPFYKKMIQAADCGIDTDWTPKFYYGFYGFDKEISSGESPEGVFAFEDLATSGFRMGPREKLDLKHIMIMTKSIAELHAASYALRIQNRKKFDEFVASFKAYPFKAEKRNMFDGLYDIALERVFRHVTSTEQADEYRKAVEEIYRKYIQRPSGLLQEFLADDPNFNIIIHGDYNRNNVMFKYESAEGFDDPIGLKMFDFQWAKYASPVLDLSFYLYMNLDPEILESSWENILKFYHESLISSIAKILKCEKIDERLDVLNYEEFTKHFARYAFYGCTIAAWFLPIMLCDLEVCKNIEIELNKDIFSTASKEICLPAGGKVAIDRVNKNVLHAFKMGYMNCLLD